MIRVEVKRRIMYIKSCNTLLNSDRVIGLFWLRDVEIESSISQQCNRKILLHPPECKLKYSTFFTVALFLFFNKSHPSKRFSDGDRSLFTPDSRR